MVSIYKLVILSLVTLSYKDLLGCVNSSATIELTFYTIFTETKEVRTLHVDSFLNRVIINK